MSDPQSINWKMLGGVLAVGGAILVTLAIVRLNSFESQFLRVFGGGDPQATSMLVLGIPVALAGIGLLFRPGASS